MAERINSGSSRRFSPYGRRDSSTHGSSSGCSSGTYGAASSFHPDLPEELDVDDLSQGDIAQVQHGSPLQLDGDEDEQEEAIYLSIMCSAGKLGAATFDAATLQLKLFTDVAEQSDHSCLSGVLTQVKPTTVICSSKQDESLVHRLKEWNAKVEVLPSMDFGIDAGKRRLLTLTTLPALKDDMTDEERTIYMTSLVPMENINMVRAAGALTKYLDRNRVGVELDDPHIPVPIISLKVCSMDAVMFVDGNSFRALQIFSNEIHPSVYKAGGSKEGLSLFGVMNKTRTAIGAKRLRNWFLRPVCNLTTLTERQLAVEFMVQPRNEEVVQTLLSCLKHVKAIPRILAKMRTASGSVADWQALYKTAYNALQIGDVCRQLPSSVPIFSKIAGAFTRSLYEIASLINKVVDFRQSVDQNRFVVKLGVDAQLDEKKNTYNGLPDFMTVVAEHELTQLDNSVTECSVIYLPQLGYLLSIPLLAGVTDDDDFEIAGLEFMFLSNGTAHYKSPSTRELDALLGDTQCEIIDKETSIMHQLQSIILEHGETLLDVMEYSADLDCLLSLAQSASEGGFVKPQLTEENILHVKGGRHPLQELCVSQFVPNDSIIEADAGRIKVLTGPNASGKSVYLKQVGLIVFLAHIGSFVPAESAVLGLRDRLFTRIATLETVSVNLSTFMLDVNQVAGAVQGSSKRSLIIIDEFGKGTATMDGVSLFCAVLRYWVDKGDECPMVLSSTHFHNVIRQGFLPSTPLLQFQMMETVMDGDEVVFLHQLVDGVTGKSHAVHIATVAGLSADIIRRSTEVSNLINAGKEVQPFNCKQSQEEFSRLSNIVDEFLELDLEKTDVTVFLKGIASRNI